MKLLKFQYFSVPVLHILKVILTYHINSLLIILVLKYAQDPVAGKFPFCSSITDDNALVGSVFW